jgi:hypothetical protein
VLLCCGHQVHISSRAGFAALGGQNFLKGLTSSCRVFSRSAYSLRILRAMYHMATNARILSIAEAEQLGIRVATEQEVAQRLELIMYLMRWIAQWKTKSPGRPGRRRSSQTILRENCCIIVRYYNAPWVAQRDANGNLVCVLKHVCQGVVCFCKSEGLTNANVASRLVRLFVRKPIIFSAGRWTLASGDV